MERFEYRLEDGLGPQQHVVVPESQNPETLGSQKCIAIGVVRHLKDMLASVQFDDNGGLQTDKVANVTTDRSLSAKFVAAELTASQTAPEQAFGIGGVAAQFASVCVHRWMMLVGRGTNLSLVQS